MEFLKTILTMMGILTLLLFAFPLIIWALNTNFIVTFILAFLGATIWFKKCWID